MAQGLTGFFGNGKGIEALSALDDQNFGYLLDQISSGDVTTDPIELDSIIGEAFNRGLVPRSYGGLAYQYLSALVRYPDTNMRCNLVKFQWHNMTAEHRDALVNSSTPVRKLIAENYVPILNIRQVQSLLCAEKDVAQITYKNAFTDEVRDLFERMGIVDSESQSFVSLVKADAKDLENCRGNGLEGPPNELLAPAVASILRSNLDLKALIPTVVEKVATR